MQKQSKESIMRFFYGLSCGSPIIVTFVHRIIIRTYAQRNKMEKYVKQRTGNEIALSRLEYVL